MPTIAEIAALLNVPVRGDAQRTITGVASLTEASPGDISYISGDTYLPQLQATSAGAVIVDQRVRLPATVKPAVLIVEDAELAMARVLEYFAPPVSRPPAGIDRDARVAADAFLDPTAAVGPMVVIGARSRIGARTIIHPGVIISEDVTIGEGCEFFPNVVIRERITIGNRVIIHSGSMLGSDGFGYRWNGTKHAKIPQIGTIVIEDDVEIGSCSCVDRAKMGVTRIGKGTKIDNLVQIAHNCQIGQHCIIVGQVGLSGSVMLGNGVVLGGQTAIREHTKVGDRVTAGGRSGILDDVEPNMTVSGMPALPHRQSLREQAALRRLPDLMIQIRKLQEEIEALKQNKEQ